MKLSISSRPSLLLALFEAVARIIGGRVHSWFRSYILRRVRWPYFG